MNPRLKKLLIANHPDRHGGDHSHMEKVFAAQKEISYVGLSKQPRRCLWAGCGAAVAGLSKHCNIHWRAAKRAAVLASFLLAFLSFGFTPAFAQKGAFSLLPTPLAVGNVNVKTNRAKFLTWDSSEGRFAIYTGATRQTLVKRFVTDTNSIALAATNYGIAAISAQGVESALAFWPSNRIGEIRLQEVGKTNVTVLEQFTNSPAVAVRLWRVVDVTVGWE